MERLRSLPGAEKGRAGRGSGGDTCAPEQGGEASGWLWENKIKAVPGGEMRKEREGGPVCCRWWGGNLCAPGRVGNVPSPWVSQLGGWPESPETAEDVINAGGVSVCPSAWAYLWYSTSHWEWAGCAGAATGCWMRGNVCPLILGRWNGASLRP